MGSNKQKELTSEQRIAVEAIAFANRFSSALSIPLRPDSLSLLEQMTGELISSVRAEAIEEAAKVCKDVIADLDRYETPPAQFCFNGIMKLLDRALVKERKGEE